MCHQNPLGDMVRPYYLSDSISTLSSNPTLRETCIRQLDPSVIGLVSNTAMSAIVIAPMIQGRSQVSQPGVGS